MQKNLKSLFGKDHGLDQKSIEHLTKVLEKNNLPGFDYLEFKLSLGALANMNMDEATSFRSAYATASTMGLTKAKLLESASHYKNVLVREREQFAKAVQNQMQHQVASKVAEVDKLKAQILKHREKIKQLEEQIAQYQNTIDGADAKINEAKQKIEGTRDNFEYAHQSILNEIDKDISHINSYL
ncbi:MAG: hypothetical protein AAGG75_24740 [Bacteroidota bacterium]